MNNITKGFLVTLIILIAFVIGVLAGRESKSYQVITLTQENNLTIEKELQPIVVTYNNTYHNTSLKYVYFEQKTQSANILRENAEYRDYDIDTYNCVQFAQRGYDKLKELNYQVDQFSTYIKDKNKYHTLLGVYQFYEPVTGEEIPPSKYGYYGIDSGLLREFNISISDEYYDQDTLTKKSITICKGLKT